MANGLYTWGFRGASLVRVVSRLRASGTPLESLPVLCRAGFWVLLLPLGLGLLGWLWPTTDRHRHCGQERGHRRQQGRAGRRPGWNSVTGDTAGAGGAGGAAVARGGAGGSAGAAGWGGQGGTGGTGPMLSPVSPPPCDAIGAEPTIPAACATVLATKTVTAGQPSDETLDTAAIQAAITACPVGQAVRLADRRRQDRDSCRRGSR